jgi:serine/threonine-protein kinase
MRLSRVALGYAAATTAFLLGVIAIEGGGAHAREPSGSAHALELAPDRAGGLRVVATPWAHVRVDGQLVETTPFARPIPLAAGKHWVTLSHPEAIGTVEREVVIVTGEALTLDVTMNVALDDAGKDAR